MKKVMLAVVSACVVFSHASFARDDIGSYSIKDALSSEVAKAKLGDDIQFYFGEQKHPKIAKSMGVFSTNKKTNAFNKSDQEACEWVFLSAMIALKDRAVKENGNAVIDIKSNYKNNLTSSDETFQCGAGSIVAGVALTGKVVKL